MVKYENFNNQVHCEGTPIILEILRWMELQNGSHALKARHSHLPSRLCCAKVPEEKGPIQVLLQEVHWPGNVKHLEQDWHMDGMVGEFLGQDYQSSVPLSIGHNKWWGLYVWFQRWDGRLDEHRVVRSGAKLPDSDNRDPQSLVHNGREGIVWLQGLQQCAILAHNLESLDKLTVILEIFVGQYIIEENSNEITRTLLHRDRKGVWS